MSKERTTLSLDMRPGESLTIGDTVVQFVHKAGQRARVRVTAPRATPIKKLVPHGHELASSTTSSAAEEIFCR